MASLQPEKRDTEGKKFILRLFTSEMILNCNEFLGYTSRIPCAH